MSSSGLFANDQRNESTRWAHRVPPPRFAAFQPLRFIYLAAVSPASRRIFLYWLLLLVPALGVGGGAILLLQREQSRLATRGAYAEEARRAAVTARARLVAENVELLVGDVETGLLDALSAEPAPGLDAFLDRWEKTNPLVRIAFRTTVEGRMLRPEARAAGEEARGFLRRFNRQFGERLPWSPAQAVPAPGVAKDKSDAGLASAEPVARKEVAANVSQVQSARRDVQELFKAQNRVAESDLAAAAPATAGSAAASGALTRSRPSAASRTLNRPLKAEAENLASADLRVADTFSSEKKVAAVAAPVAPPEATRVAKDAAAPDRRGWQPALVDGRLHLVGWLQPGGAGEVRGVEVELAALISRLAGTLPAEVGEGEGYALRDEQGRVLHQAGAVGRGGAGAIRVPLATALLPGWEVTAYLPATAEGSADGTGFLGLGVLLVAIFVAAILAGGALLLRQARQSEEEAGRKTSFVANVSHEFKTPLTTIRLYAELLEQGRVRDAAQGSEYLRTIGRETQRLARLVNNALDFSRLEQGRKKYARESLDLAAELRRILATLEPRVAEAALVLKPELPGEPVLATTDRDAVEQIVINLVDNACKYAADGGEVRVVLRRSAAGRTELRVGDRGPGVPAEHRERIFEKFHRVDDALTAEKSGAGLGLSIARQLARGLGGSLRCEARDDGGAEFILELP